MMPLKRLTAATPGTWCHRKSWSQRHQEHDDTKSMTTTTPGTWCHRERWSQRRRERDATKTLWPLSDSCKRDATKNGWTSSANTIPLRRIPFCKDQPDTAREIQCALVVWRKVALHREVLLLTSILTSNAFTCASRNEFPRLRCKKQRCPGLYTMTTWALTPCSSDASSRLMSQSAHVLVLSKCSGYWWYTNMMFKYQHAHENVCETAQFSSKASHTGWLCHRSLDLYVYLILLHTRWPS